MPSPQKVSAAQVPKERGDQTAALPLLPTPPRILPETTPQREPSPTMKALERLALDPAVMGGKPCIRGTRVTVGTVVGLLAAGRSIEEVLEAYPYLSRADVEAVLAYAAWRSEEVEVLLDRP